MMTHEELKKKILSNPDVKSEYDALKEEFSLFDELLKETLINRVFSGLHRFSRSI